MTATAPTIETAARPYPITANRAPSATGSGLSVSGHDLQRDLVAVWPRLQRIVAGFGFAQADAEDVLQDVSVRAIERDATRRDREDATGWLVRITVNRCIEEHRRRTRRRRQDAALPPEPTQTASERPECEEDEIAMIRDLLAGLEERLAAPLVLGYYCDMTSAQIGELLGEPAATIRTRQRQARLLLAKQLRARGVEP